MKPYIQKQLDGSILFEWIHQNCRFGISLEKDIKDSSWYFVSKKPFFSEGSYLPKEFIDQLKELKDESGKEC